MRDFKDKVVVMTGAASDIEQAALDQAVNDLRARNYDVLGVRTRRPIDGPAQVADLLIQAIQEERF